MCGKGESVTRTQHTLRLMLMPNQHVVSRAMRVSSAPVSHHGKRSLSASLALRNDHDQKLQSHGTA